MRDKEAPPTFVLSDPLLPPFLGPAVNPDESIRILTNWMTLLLFIWPFFFLFADSIFAFHEDGGRGGDGVSLCPGSSTPLPFFSEAGV